MENHVFRVRALELALGGNYIDWSDEAVIERARKFHDFLAGTRDAEVIDAARTLAEKLE